MSITWLIMCQLFPCIYYDSLHELIKIENGIRYTENSRVIPGCNEFNIADGHSARAYYFQDLNQEKAGYIILLMMILLII